MAKRLLLVDEEMYKGLLRTAVKEPTPKLRPNPEEGDKATNFGFIKKELKKGRNKRGGNLRAKNYKLNRNLKRYLKMRKEKNEKPIKIGLPKNNTSLVVNPETNEMATVTENGDLEPVEQQRVSFRSPLTTSSVSFSSPLATSTPSSSLLKTPKTMDLEKRIEKFVNYIMKHAEEFGVTKDGLVIGPTNKPMLHSDLDETARRILDPDKVYTYSPAGTSKIRKLAQNSKYLSELINPKGRTSFSGDEGGSGFKIATPRRFYPQKWSSSRKH